MSTIDEMVKALRGGNPPSLEDTFLEAIAALKVAERTLLDGANEGHVPTGLVDETVMLTQSVIEVFAKENAKAQAELRDRLKDVTKQDWH